MTTPPTPARSSAAALGRAPLTLLALATLIAGGCSDGDDDPAPAEEIFMDLPMPEDDPEAEGDDPEIDDPTTEIDDPTTENPQAPIEEPIDVPPGRDDREGLEVIFPGDRDPAALSSPWLAIVDVFQNATSPNENGEVYVNLLRYANGFDFLRHADFYTAELDVCEPIDNTDGDEGGGDDEDVDPRAVSGGPAVTLSSAGGEWASVPFSSELTAYDNGDAGFPGLLPDDLTLSAPGEEFPAIDALPIDLPEFPLRLSPAIGEPITASTEYRWTPADDGAFVRIVFKNFLDGEFQAFVYDCTVRDDGEFDLPEDVRSALLALPGRTTVRYVRERNALGFRDGVAVFRSVDLVDD